MGVVALMSRNHVFCRFAVVDKRSAGDYGPKQVSKITNRPRGIPATWAGKFAVLNGLRRQSARPAAGTAATMRRGRHCSGLLTRAATTDGRRGQQPRRRIAAVGAGLRQVVLGHGPDLGE